jgi:hypothetical protein
MKMTEYYAQRPNMYTGTANVSVPLYTIDFDGWKLPLSVSYNATGIRTNEEASEIGLGWALSATGVISRTINGADDFYRALNHLGQATDGRKGFVYMDEPLSSEMGYGETPCENQPCPLPPLDSYYHYLASKQHDTQPDIFNYNFFGYSGSFVLTRKESPADTIDIVKLTEDASSISYNETAGTFTVITPQGFKGTFAVREKSTTFSSTSSEGTSTDNFLTCCSELFINPIYSRDNSGMFRTTSSWYLTSIQSPHGKTITFSYALNQDGSSSYISQSRAFGEFPGATDPRMCIQTVHEHVYLTAITSDEVRIDLLMEDRDDLRINTLFAGMPTMFPQGLKLKRYASIHIDGLDPSSTLDKTINFKQNYFNQSYHNLVLDNENEVRFLRSRLDRITIDDQEYNFHYEKTGGLPDKLTSAVDHFGFYNGVEQLNAMLLPPDPMPGEALLGSSDDPDDADSVQLYHQSYSRLVDFAYGKAGLLTKVSYPTRGYSVFEYEPHRYYPDQTLPFRENVHGSEGNPAGGARIRSIKDYSYDSVLAQHKEYRYTESPTDAFSGTTGKIMTPLYNRYAQPVAFGDDINFIYRTHSGIPGSNSAQGKIIGYSKVHEIVTGQSDSYKNTYSFENRPNLVADFNVTAGGWPNLNGQTIQVKNYDNSGKIVQYTVNDAYYQTTGSVQGIVYEPQSPPGDGQDKYLRYVVPYRLEKTFVMPQVVVTTTAKTPSEIIENVNGVVSLGNSNQVTTITGYNSKFLLNMQQVTDSTSDVLVTEYRRPTDYVVKSSAMELMSTPTTNIVEPIIEEITKKNGAVIGARGNLYGISGSTVDLLSVYVWNRSLGSFAGSANGGTFPSPYELRATFSKYSNGKLQEYTTSDGVTNSFIWGHGNTVPIVHGINIDHTKLDQAHSAALGPNYETAIRGHANTLGKQITTYGHIPLVGITKVTNASLIKRTFVYDDGERLKQVKDNDENTLEQYEYHFKERQLTRILDIPTTLDFGAQVEDFFQPTFIPYQKCGSATRTLVLENTGEDDLVVTNIDVPYGYTLNWNGGVVPPNGQVDILVYFNQALDLDGGTYNGNIVFTSNKTGGGNSVAVTGTLVDRNCNLSLSKPIIDFGQTTGNYVGQQLVVTNTGNGSLRIIGTPLNWDEIGQNHSAFTHPDFKINPTPICIPPVDGTQTFQVNFTPQAAGQLQTATLSFITDVGCPPTNIILKGQRRPANQAMVMEINPAPVPLLQFTGVSASTQIQVKNTGVYTMHVTGVTPEVNDPKFSITPTAFDVEPGATQIVTVTLTPDAFDFTQHDITYTFQSDKTSGTNTVAISARRNALRAVTLSDPLARAFDVGGEHATVYIDNIGNDNIYFTDDGVSFAFPVTGTCCGTPESSSQYWDATVSNSSAPLGPNDSPRAMTITMKPNISTWQRQYVIVDYNKTTGVQNALIELIPEIRKIGFPSPTTTITASEDQVFSGALAVSNPGNAPLTIYGVQFSDSRFSMTSPSPSQSFSIPAGESVNITVRYSANDYDFAQRSSTVTFDGNMTTGGGNEATVNARRTLRRGLGIVGNDLFTNANQSKTITIRNTGNNYQYLTSASFQYSLPDWSIVTEPQYDVNFAPYGIAPGDVKTMIVRLNTPSPDTQTINLKYNSPSSDLSDATESIVLSAATKILSYPVSTVTLTSTSNDPLTGSLNLYNAGNTTLSLDGYNSSNSDFTVTNTFPIQINPNTSATMNVAYTPDAGDFDIRSTTITFSGDHTGFFNSVATTTIQGTWIKKVQLTEFTSQGWNLSFSLPAKTNQFQNTGNVPIRITDVYFESGSEFDLSFQIGTNVYDSVGAFLAASSSNRVLTRNAVMNVTLSSTVGFPTQAAIGTFWIEYVQDESPNTTGTSIQVNVARAAH